MIDRLKTIALALTLVTSGFAAGAATFGGQGHSQIVGSWYATTVGAPYVDHVLQFDNSGNVLINNPGRVQEQPDGSGTNDSIGVGAWRYDRGTYRFTFVELNAIQGTGTPAPQTEISFVVTFDRHGLWSGTWSGGGHDGTIQAVRKISAS